MSITKSYNRKTRTYYAYETTYEWSDEKQKKIQRKKCIGQIDPDTGAIVPNGRVGRPSLPEQSRAATEKHAGAASPEKIGDLISRLDAVGRKMHALSDEVKEIQADIVSLLSGDGE